MTASRLLDQASVEEQDLFGGQVVHPSSRYRLGCERVYAHRLCTIALAVREGKRDIHPFFSKLVSRMRHFRHAADVDIRCEILLKQSERAR